MDRSTNAAAVLSCQNLDISVAERTLVTGLAISLDPGEVLAVLGRNGSGKTLMMHTLAGLRDATVGNIRLGGNPLQSLDRQVIARQLALLPQRVDDIFPATVLDTVLIGRHPHIGRFNWETAHDLAVARRALKAVDLDALEHRDIFTLSGGERRRLAIAQVLAQEPQNYLLDEPTNHLDPQHQIDTLRLFRRIADDQGAAVIANLHDVNLAVRFADRCLLLFGDGS